MRRLNPHPPDWLFHAIGTLALALGILMLTACSASAQVPPALQQLSTEWEADLPPRTVWTTPAGDTALVLDAEGIHIRARYQGATYVQCASTGAELFALDDLTATADSVLRHGAPYDSASLWVARAECVTTFRALADSIQ